MYDEQQRPDHGPMAGFTVGVTAARRADELGALLQRRGAAVLHAPALRIVPLVMHDNAVRILPSPTRPRAQSVTPR